MPTRPALAHSALAISVVVLAGCGAAAGTSSITASDVRTPVPAGPNGAVYMTLTNDGDADDRLVSASSDVAESVEIHESSMQDGTMSMQQIDGIDIPAGGTAVLETGGVHVMLIGVDANLAEGDTFDLTLSFDNADDQTVEVEVVPLVDDGMSDIGSEATMGETGSEG